MVQLVVCARRRVIALTRYGKQRMIREDFTPHSQDLLPGHVFRVEQLRVHRLSRTLEA